MSVMRNFFSVMLALVIAFSSPLIALAATTAPTANSLQSQIDAQNQEIAALNQQIAQYEAKIQQAGADKKTLQAALNALDLQKSEVETQISATQHQINATKLQIQQLGTGIAETQQSIGTSQAGLAEDVRYIQGVDDRPFILQFFSSDSFGNVWGDVGATLELQAAIENQIGVLQSQKNALTTSQTASKQKQTALVSQKQSLTSQQQSLTQTQKTKKQLLAETNAQESTYEKLLAQAKAELTSFSTFATNAGGSKLLANQTVCDGWGCYYNQRDVAWGNLSLNGTGYRLAADGCLVTSMAMVMTHYGYRDVTPVTINANPSNFAAYFPAYLLYTITVDGMTVTRKSSLIDATLATGNPVVIGLRAYGGTHFVVLVGGRNGNYVMRDPYIANGNDISFAAHYSLQNIFGVSRVVISG